MKISVVINTYNAGKFLKQTLESVNDLDEIIVCDMHSTDDTIAIAEQYNSKILYHEKIDYVEPARNFAISQANNEWVLLLDADEAVSKDLVAFLTRTTKNNKKISCFAIPRKNYFMNKWMRSAYPDYVYRFFKKDKINWPNEIHSIPKIEGEIFKIPTKLNLAIEHLADDSISLILNKNNTYSTAEIPKRINTKVNLSKLIFSPFFWFVKYYFIKQGFRDGIPGFIFACLKAQYKFSTLSKIYEHNK